MNKLVPTNSDEDTNINDEIDPDKISENSTIGSPDDEQKSDAVTIIAKIVSPDDSPTKDMADVASPGEQIYDNYEEREMQAKIFEQSKYPYRRKIARSTYEKDKARLQVELLKVQRWVEETGQKIVMIFEGRDAAGQRWHYQTFHRTSQSTHRTG